MGYFSNGSEGEDYYERYCSRCVHNKNEDCPVWDAHLLKAKHDGTFPPSKTPLRSRGFAKTREI